MSSLKDLSDSFSKVERILLASHENPDHDALGSILALGFGLSSIGKRVDLYNSGSVPNQLRYLPGWENIKTGLNELNENYEIIALLDCTDIYRPGKQFGDYVINRKDNILVIIDHHNTNDAKADLSLVDKEVASTGVLVFKLLKQLGIEIDKNIADCLLSTIIGDTGSFRYSNTNPEALKISGELLESGADLNMISQAIYENEPVNKIKLISEALDTLDINENGKIGSMYVDKSMYEKTGTSREDTEGIVNILRSIKGISVAVFYKEDENSSSTSPSWKISLRSKDDVDVSKIASSFGGGGHIKASGFSIEGDIKNVKKKVLKSIENEIQ